jgi:hypothetical protein
MAVTNWKSSIKTNGTVIAGYYGDTSGTAYMLMQGLGTAYKMNAGTAQLSGGSVNVTTNLTSVKAAVASAVSRTACGAHIYNGTIPLTCVFLAGAGTMAIVYGAGLAAGLGTSFVSWQAIGT